TGPLAPPRPLPHGDAGISLIPTATAPDAAAGPDVHEDTHERRFSHPDRRARP
ncbi:MAG: hypothetical protein ACJAVS_001539, partial [Paracoccaceae bacterium]